MGLGDAIHRALEVVGVTPDRVERLVGGPCGCDRRQEQLNSLGRWATRVLRGKVDKAKEYLEEILNADDS